jgi:hypothetical protein
MPVAWHICCWPNCRFPVEDDLPLCGHHARDTAAIVNEWPEDKGRVQLTPEDIARRKQRRADYLATKRGQWGQIYYIRLNDVIKIGWTSNLHSRLIDYNPGAVLLAHHAGTRTDERDLHRSFKPLRVHGREWYDGNASIILDHIAKVIDQHGEPTIKLDMTAPPRPMRPKAGPTVTAGKHHA